MESMDYFGLYPRNDKKKKGVNNGTNKKNKNQQEYEQGLQAV